MGLRILGLESFDAGSHRAVREAIEDGSRHAWTWITRPGRAWNWRMRLSAHEMVEAAARDGVFDGGIDAIFVSSLTSVADLRAALPAGCRDLPVVLYMHENQAAYPFRESRERDVHFALTNLTSVLAADRVAWNSRWNLESFLVGIDRILAAAPDADLRDVEPRIRAASEIVWPPVEPPPFETAADHDRSSVLHKSARVVWPHRWEHDKGPEALLELAERFREGEVRLRWIILGERYRETPPALEAFLERFADDIDHVGYAEDRAAYWAHLRSADWVLSTARHEFFGLAVVEALLAGCLPWLPPRLSYPELLPDTAHGLDPTHPPDDPDAVRRAIAAHLEPALATSAVARLDELIRRTAEAGRRASGV